MSKETDLDALAATVHDFTAGEIPPEAVWDINGTVLSDALALIGDFFTDTDGDVAALLATYTANHNPDGSHAPPSEWIPEVGAPTFLSASSFTLPGNRTANYRAHDRVRLHQGAGGTTLVVAAVTAVSFASATNTTTLVVRTATTTAPVVSTLVSIDRALARDSLPRIGGFDLIDGALDDPRLFVDGVIRNNMLAVNCVGRGQIANGEVIAGKLGASAVASANIAALQVLETHLAAGAVTAAKIGNGQVQVQHIADANIDGTTHIADGTIVESKYGTDSVSSRALAPAAVTPIELAPNAVTTGKILNKAVTAAKREDIQFQQGWGANTPIAATYEQFGWGYVTVPSGGARAMAKVIVFPVTFAQVLNIQVTATGLKPPGPTPPASLDDSTALPTGTLAGYADENPIVTVQGGSITGAGFQVFITPNATTLGIWDDGTHVLFFWRALGY